MADRWNGVCKALRLEMSLNGVCKLIVSASLSLSCARPAAVAPLRPVAPVRVEYVTIVPEVSYSRTGQDQIDEQPPLSADEDVMASILAVPRGASGRQGSCTDCSPEDRSIPR